MSLRTILRSAWRDSVWSKVIAAGITTALGAAAALAIGSWHGLEDRASAVWGTLGGEMAVPVWLVAGLALVAVVLAVMSMVLWAWAERAARQTGPEIQPNAVLVDEARVVEAPPPVGRPFDALSDEQRAFLRRIYRRGSRGFEMPGIQIGLRWFEMLERHGYVRAMDSPFASPGGTAYEVTDAGWREIERALR